MKTIGMKESLAGMIDRHKEAVEKSFSEAQLEILENISREFIKALKSKNKLLFCGNGGSAADSQHIAAEFIGRFKRERMSLPALALTTDTSILTAVANDYDYKDIFSRQVEGLGNAGDVLVAISTSGNSVNVLEAVRKAKEKNMVTIGFTGAKGGTLAGLTDLCFRSQSNETSRIQEMHITALHAVSEVVEEVFFGG